MNFSENYMLTDNEKDYVYTIKNNVLRNLAVKIFARNALADVYNEPDTINFENEISEYLHRALGKIINIETLEEYIEFGHEQYYELEFIQKYVSIEDFLHLDNLIDISIKIANKYNLYSRIPDKFVLFDDDIYRRIIFDIFRELKYSNIEKSSKLISILEFYYNYCCNSDIEYIDEDIVADAISDNFNYEDIILEINKTKDKATLNMIYAAASLYKMNEIQILEFIELLFRDKGVIESPNNIFSEMLDYKISLLDQYQIFYIIRLICEKNIIFDDECLDSFFYDLYTEKYRDSPIEKNRLLFFLKEMSSYKWALDLHASLAENNTLIRAESAVKKGRNCN